MRISDWSSDVCSSDVGAARYVQHGEELLAKFLQNSLRLTMARMRVLYRSRAQHSEGPRPGSLQTACLPRATIEERSEEHTSELQSLLRISYAVFCLQKKKNIKPITHTHIKSTT